ncbi:hypothetical protein BCR34DRAFT_121136 [Clohesyomyces aquaticus]|uniref:HMG box domain-containing protein n=1 Tax=Clohesyomyces aquaticus TaxID=1231657 RepID=A0A1Y2A1G9_9PLEO|nr:hypothetical protein BCR34DRAFT_121136 [Clohesyomyces aquaticus]
MSELRDRLERLGLSQYFEVFVAEGFDTWEIVLDITESDLNALSVKLGHRRLQRAIAESRGQSHDRPLPIALGISTSADYRSDDSAPDSKGRQGEGSTAPGIAGTSTKRKYRRHPKPDENAPERPPSAYVIFSNQVRESLKGQELSFTEIAKIVGERWQVLPTDAREACERQANTAKEKYYAQMAEYKKTPQHDAYQKYLEDFKAKHAAQQKGKSHKRALPDLCNHGLTGGEGKRPRPTLETETSTSTRSSAQEQSENYRKTSTTTAQSDQYAMSHSRSETSPPLGLARLPAGNPYGSKSTSPAMHSLSGLNSPRSRDVYSPMSMSPRSATLQKESSIELPINIMTREARDRYPDPGPPFQSPSYGHPNSVPSTTPPSAVYGSHYQAPVEPPSRRPVWEPTRLPPLSHDDTTLSSESGGGYAGSASYVTHSLPIVDSSKSMRVLPHPVPSIGATQSPLDRYPPASSSQPPQDYRVSSSLAALLRAGEIVSRAEEDAMDRKSSP